MKLTAVVFLTDDPSAAVLKVNSIVVERNGQPFLCVDRGLLHLIFCLGLLLLRSQVLLGFGSLLLGRVSLFGCLAGFVLEVLHLLLGLVIFHLGDLLFVLSFLLLCVGEVLRICFSFSSWSPPPEAGDGPAAAGVAAALVSSFLVSTAAG